MNFAWLWIIPKTLIFFIIYAVYEFGDFSCLGFLVQNTGNSSTESEYNVLHNYLNTVLNRSRAIEEVIYSDILNNLRSIINEEKHESVDSDKSDGRGKSSESRKKQKTKNVEWSSPKTNVFLSGSGDTYKKETTNFDMKNVTVGDSKDEYLLGYSGNPFGTHQPLPGLIEISQNDPFGKAVGDPRRKRSVLHLYNMVLCTTGCNPFAYKGYGCYCGFLGSGYVVDGIDSCCKMHDWCYNTAGCPMFLEYFIPYLWKCYHHQPLCAIDHGYYGGPSSCAQRLCECDRQLALCLRRYPCPSTKALCTSSPWRLLQNIIML